MIFSWLEDQDIRIFVDHSRSQKLQVSGAFTAQTVDAYRILRHLNLLRHPRSEPFELPLVEAAFEDGKLDPFSEILQRVSQPGAPAVLPDIIRDDDQHGKMKLS
jgi:hypothetical protein